MKCYNSKTNYKYDKNNTNNTNLHSSNLKQGILYFKNNDDLMMKPQPKESNSFVKDFLQLFRTTNTTESFIGSISQTPLNIPILGESGSQRNNINPAVSGSNRSTSTTTAPAAASSGTTTTTTASSVSTTSTASTASTAALQNIQLKYSEFNQLLAQYTAQYKIMANELIQNNNKEILQKYANSNIKLNNDFYFVNEYGFAHKYDATENPTTGTISTSCNFAKPPTEITTLEFSQLLAGQKMGLKQSCGIAGYNVENSSNGEKSFIDIKGVKHIYSGEVWNKKHESCNIDKKSITNDEYKNIPLGTAMTENTFCATINVDPLVLERLLTLNKQLQTLGNTVLTEMNLISTSQQGTNLNNNVNLIRSSITDRLQELNQSQQDILRIGDEYNSTGNIGVVTDSSNTIKARTRDTQILVNMNYLKYMIGFILVVFLVIITFYVFSYEISSPLLILLLIILIILVLFNFFNFMYNKLYHNYLNKILLYG
jgi:hypothetical protein